MDKGRFLRAPEQANDTAMDKYTAAIELSNACRQFYQARVEAANCIKSRWQMHAHSTRCNDNDRPAEENSKTTPERRHRNSIDEAMEKLRTEMTSLMDQDLSLMKQLLTLNETIEDLKWQRRYYYSRSSLQDSSADLASSLSDMSESEDDEDELSHRQSRHHHHSHHHHHLSHDCTASTSSTISPTPRIVLLPPHSSPSIQSSSPSSSSSSSSSSSRPSNTYVSTTTTTSTLLKSKLCQAVSTSCHASARADGKLTRVSGKVYHSEQDSFDSGIHETCSSSGGEEEAVL